jgi:hypothetical protein
MMLTFSHAEDLYIQETLGYEPEERVRRENQPETHVLKSGNHYADPVRFCFALIFSVE